MLNDAVLTLALRRDYRPLDANIDVGRVVVFATGTVTTPLGATVVADSNCVVLPNSSYAISRAFAGIAQSNGKQGNIYVSTPTDIDADISEDFIKDNGLPLAALKANSAITIGDPVGYDPTGAGVVERHVDGRTVRIGIAQQTMSSSSDIQLFPIQLAPAGSWSAGVYSSLLAVGSAVSNTATETALCYQDIPANVLRAVRQISVDAVQKVYGTANTLRLRGYLHKSSVAFDGSGSLTLFDSGALAVTAGDLGQQRFTLDLMSLVLVSANGSQVLDAAGSALLSMGLPASAWDGSVSNRITITALWGGTSATDDVRAEAFTLSLA